jgi:hypothetical protein
VHGGGAKLFSTDRVAGIVAERGVVICCDLSMIASVAGCHAFCNRVASPRRVAPMVGMLGILEEALGPKYKEPPA